VNWLNILVVSICLAMDAFAVSISTGLKQRLSFLQIFRLSFTFGFFQFAMPLIGWELGKEIAILIDAFDHWIAFGLLAFVGGKMLWEAKEGRQSENRADATKGVRLLLLALATSIDALSVGLSLAFLHVSIVFPSIIIGVITFILSALGAEFGRRIGGKWGARAEFAGGTVLILIGLRILYSHLTA
jgi:putative Mn2+ efflux pump MntP